jgi:AraC-like DNA-binding protein
LKADAAARVVHAPLGQFANANVHLVDVFSAGDVSTCNDLLVSARNGSERIAAVESFLLQRLRPSLETMAGRVAALIEKDPGLQVQQLALEMGVSTRHLSRSFNTTFGVGLKQFARLARIEGIVTRRSNGLPWAGVAYACGLSDQAHLIKEFREIVGQSPTRFFEQEIRIGTGIIRDPNFIIERVEEDRKGPLAGGCPTLGGYGLFTDS